MHFIRVCGVGAIAFAAVIGGCQERNVGTTELGSDDRGWQLANARVTSVQTTSPGLIGVSGSGAIRAFDGATGALRWSAPIPAGYVAPVNWDGDRFASLAWSIDGSPTRLLIGDASTGALFHDAPLPVGLALTRIALFDRWALGIQGDNALVGFDRNADSVRWRISYSPAGCPTREPGNCRFFWSIGRIAGTGFVIVTDRAVGTTQLLAIDSSGIRSSLSLPLVSEPPLSSPEFRGIDAVDSLVWFASGTSVYAANATGGQIRWRVITSELIAPRAHIAVDFVHASEDGIARELRVAYYARDSVTGAEAIEAVVLRMTDGRIVRRLSLPLTRTRATLSHIGACGTGGVALVSSDGTVNYARWSDGVTSVWRSQLIAQAGQPSEVTVFQPVFPSHLLVTSLTSNAIAVVNCAA